MNQFDERKGAFTSWSTRIAINTAINEGKKRARHQSVEQEVHVPVEPERHSGHGPRRPRQHTQGHA